MDRDWSQFNLPQPPINGNQVENWTADVLFLLLKKVHAVEDGGCTKLQDLYKQVSINTKSAKTFNRWWDTRGVYLRIGTYALVALWAAIGVAKDFLLR